MRCWKTTEEIKAGKKKKKEEEEGEEVEKKKKKKKKKEEEDKNREVPSVVVYVTKLRKIGKQYCGSKGQRMTWVKLKKQLYVSVIGLYQKELCRVTQIDMKDSNKAQLWILIAALSRC